MANGGQCPSWSLRTAPATTRSSSRCWRSIASPGAHAAAGVTQEADQASRLSWGRARRAETRRQVPHHIPQLDPSAGRARAGQPDLAPSSRDRVESVVPIADQRAGRFVPNTGADGVSEVVAMRRTGDTPLVRAVELTFALGWAAFWIFWLVAAFF